jgi:acetyl esterase/lipase
MLAMIGAVVLASGAFDDGRAASGPVGPGVAIAAGAAADVKVVTDVDYVPGAVYPDKKDRLDIYAPAGAANAPVIVAFHGGGLRQGDKSEQAFVGRRFASAGIVTVVANYRLSPPVVHPAHVEDAAAAVAWVKAHIGAHGGDPDKVFVIGHSAGAYLAALLALDGRYLATHQLSPSSVRGFVPVSGFFYVERQDVAPSRPKDTWGTDPATWVAASPGKYVRDGVPPMLLLYADGDDEWRRAQQTEFASALKKAGSGNVALHMVAKRSHQTVWNDMATGAEETSDTILRFIHERLTGGSSR